mgnify:CR=1 FL=1
MNKSRDIEKLKLLVEALGEIEDPIAQVRVEVEYELGRVLVDEAKDKLKRAKWWHKVIPFTITVERR